MLESTITHVTRLLAAVITSPWMQSNIMRETWMRVSDSAY
jgi:hypothetical protein